ncbi:MAG: DegT/DnrJ/EryC1/StrS family aminotransferase [Anaerolineales bacterium]|jgi:dTDP-4-amino-4,6-dideoxygalactose transaminase|nr:DegT/DnrJ/EryC1/StrS family aminotransferase [Anaerolineales bacterium]
MTHFEPIPILDLKAQYATIRADVEAAIARVMESQHFILGPEVEALEQEIAAYCGCQFGIGVSSGTDALLVSLMAVGIKPGDEVITSPYSFFATAGAIVRLGARPVFVDIDLDTLNMDAGLVEAAITERTRAILPVHLAGQMADMDAIMEIAKQHNLYVIEDACQALGADFGGRRAGSIGHLGCFSFFPSKNLGGAGDSGMVIANDPALADRVALLRNHGHRPKYYNQAIGGNFRMDALQAAILRAKLPHLEAWTAARQRNAALYRQFFLESGLVSETPGLREQKPLVLPHETGWGRHIYHLYQVRVQNRAGLMAHLKANQIGSEIYYPIPLHLQACFEGMGYARGDCPNAERAAEETLALPIYPELGETQISRVVQGIADFYNGQAA